MSKVINPSPYQLLLKGQAPCNYSLTSNTLYRSLQRPEWMTTPNQIEAFYKFDYDTFNINYAFRTFESDDPRMYNIVMITDKGIYKDDVTRSLLDDIIYMRWTTFVTKIEETRAGLIVSNDYNTDKVCWFYPKCACDCPGESGLINITDTYGKKHIMKKSPLLLQSLRDGLRYVEVEAKCYVPVMNFRMWHMVF